MSAERTALALCLDVLGPLTLRIDGQEVEVPGTRRRALLALLALEAGRVASTERLVECLWPDEPPLPDGTPVLVQVTSISVSAIRLARPSVSIMKSITANIGSKRSRGASRRRPRRPTGSPARA